MRKVYLFLCLFAALLLAGCEPHYKAPFTLGSNIWTGYEPLYLARHLGYYPEKDIRLVELSATPQALDALRTGLLDSAGLTLDETLMLLNEGVPISVVWVLNVSHGADALLARPEFPSISSLKGKRIGVEQTAIGAYMLQAALAQAGLSHKDVQIVPLTIDEHLSAYRSGRVDALITFDPIRQTLLKEGALSLLDSSLIEDGDTFDVLVVRRPKLECCSAAIAKIIEGQQQALTFLQEHPSLAWQEMAKRPNQSIEEVAAALRSLKLPSKAENQAFFAGSPSPLLQSARATMEQMLKQGLLSAPLDLSQLFDDRFARKGAQ